MASQSTYSRNTIVVAAISSACRTLARRNLDMASMLQYKTRISDTCSLPHERDQRFRPLLIGREFIRKLLRHELVFCAHAPEKNGTKEDEKKDPRAAADNRRTDACDETSSIHRMAHATVRTRRYQFV